ncbi:hypothetical protein DFH06DRAFT_1407744 [Mycena polygramma]|nr:hypothetical protein DFH06DRAFT_1407744 [Mycena polygramma]
MSHAAVASRYDHISVHCRANMPTPKGRSRRITPNPGPAVGYTPLWPQGALGAYRYIDGNVAALHLAIGSENRTLTAPAVPSASAPLHGPPDIADAVVACALIYVVSVVSRRLPAAAQRHLCSSGTTCGSPRAYIRRHALKTARCKIVAGIQFRSILPSLIDAPSTYIAHALPVRIAVTGYRASSRRTVVYLADCAHDYSDSTLRTVIPKRNNSRNDAPHLFARDGAQSGDRVIRGQGPAATHRIKGDRGERGECRALSMRTRNLLRSALSSSVVVARGGGPTGLCEPCHRDIIPEVGESVECRDPPPRRIDLHAPPACGGFLAAARPARPRAACLPPRA